MPTGVGQDKPSQGWIGRLEELGAVLDRGHEMAGKIIGLQPTAEEETKEPGCLAGRIDSRLAVVILSASHLVDQLERIQVQF